MQAEDIALVSDDGHRWSLIARIPESANASLVWLPALGVAARHYIPFAEALAARGIATFLHEWRGHGSSDVRASHDCNWGYRELLEHDIPASQRAAAERMGGDLPAILGGHSLGGQLSACRLALAPESAARLWLVGSGVPFPSAFSGKMRWGLPLAFRFLPWLASHFGALPGRRIGFGGREAEGVMRDWAGTGRAGAYRIGSMNRDLDPLLAEVRHPIHAVLLQDDWYSPESSMRALTDKMSGPVKVHHLSRTQMDGHADHFSWMKTPEPVVKQLVHQVDSRHSLAFAGVGLR